MITDTRNKIFIISISLLILLSSCLPKLHVKRLKLDDKLGFYTYPYANSDIALRNNSGHLVTRQNIIPFLQALDGNNSYYDFANLSEQTAIISQKDEQLVYMYGALVSSLENQNKEAASFYISELRHIYPNVNYYTDLFFLEGVLAETNGDSSKATICYSNFYNYSEKKYSGFFRGNVYNESIKKCFIAEKQYALNHINKYPITDKIDCNLIPTHKYYYQSFTKGFVLNREDFRESTRLLPGFLLTYTSKIGPLAGASVSWLPNENFITNAQILFSKYSIQLNIAFPIQVYKTFNNRLGLKLTPIIENNLIQKFDDGNSANRFFLNPGTSVSIGYNILPRLSAGAAVTYFYFNENNRKAILNHKVYNNNIASVGLQYLIIKGLAIRADLINGKPVIGLNLSGAFVGYNFYSRSFGLFNRDY